MGILKRKKVSTITWNNELYKWVLKQSGNNKRAIPSTIRSLLTMVMNGVIVLNSSSGGVGVYNPNQSLSEKKQDIATAIADKRNRKRKNIIDNLSEEEKILAQQKVQVFHDYGDLVNELKDSLDKIRASVDKDKPLIEEMKQERNSIRQSFTNPSIDPMTAPPPPTSDELI